MNLEYVTLKLRCMDVSFTCISLEADCAYHVCTSSIKWITLNSQILPNSQSSCTIANTALMLQMHGVQLHYTHVAPSWCV